MRRGSSAHQRTFWRTTYQRTPYQELPWYDPDPSPQVERAVRDGFLRPRSAVLDIGCGAGSNLLFLARQRFEAHGIDLSPDAVRHAQARAKERRLTIEARVGDALDLDYAPRRFQGAIDNGCFHTLPVGRRRDYAREVARVLRPGGAFVLSWIGREHTAAWGPPHRPSLEEVTRALEPEFLFERTEFHAPDGRRGPAIYDARLTRRGGPQPPPR